MDASGVVVVVGYSFVRVLVFFFVRSNKYLLC